MRTMTEADYAAMPDEYKSTRWDGVRCVLSLEPEGTCLVPVQVLDGRDAELLASRTAWLRKVRGPRCGDFVRFADGRLERVSNVWPDGVQTSEGGRFYLGAADVSFSGGLNPSFPIGELRLTDEERLGACWFFHHGTACAGGGVDVEAPFRVYEAAGVREHVFGLGRDWWSSYVAGASVPPELHIPDRSELDVDDDRVSRGSVAHARLLDSRPGDDPTARKEDT